MNLRWRIAQYFEIRWWQRYLGLREKTEYLSWKRRYWNDFLQQCDVRIPHDAGILDAGCGPAGIFIALEHRRVDALDPLLYRYEKTLPHFRRSDYPHVRFFDTPLEHFFPEKQYDFVFCLNAINHVADLSGCFDRLAALTKPGGILALSVDVHRFSQMKSVFRLVPADILHPHQHGLEEYRAMLAGRSMRIAKEILIRKGGIFNYYLLLAEKA